jgi:hypothetical protein
MNKLKEILRSVFDDSAYFFPYVFLIYIITIILNLIFDTFFVDVNMLFFSLGIILLGLLAFLSVKTKKNLKKIRSLLKKKEYKKLINFIFKTKDIIKILSFKYSIMSLFICLSFTLSLLFTLIKEPLKAEIFGIYGYYFFLIIVFLRIVNLIRGR